MPPKRNEDFDIDISGSLEGIGAVLQEDGAYIKVVSIVPGGAAWRQKELEVNDIILMVSQGKKDPSDPVDLEDMRVDDAVRFIRGKKGTEVQLTVKKPDGARQTISIIRDVVHIGASYAKSSVLDLPNIEGKIGYIHVPKFYRDFGDKNSRNCTDDVRSELVRLKKAKVAGIILDLRNNGGGALEDAKQMSGLFIKEGPIVQVKNYSGKVEVLPDDDKEVVYGGPLVVMINRFSASASEILAAALQDYGRAVIVGGQYSHGKGTVQAVLNLDQGPLMSMFGSSMGALKVTIQKFYRINGGSTQFKGVTPDILLTDPLGYGKNREQDLDFPMPWDEIKGLSFIPWSKHKYNMKKIKVASKKRTNSSKRFKTIRESLKYLNTRLNDTKLNLNLDMLIADDKKNKIIVEKFKFDQENKDLKVTNFEESLMTADHIRSKDKEKWKKDFEQRKEEWVKALRSDILLEETLYIMKDMIGQIK